MAADINVKIALDGERDYRAALKNCNDALKNADSALKAFDESAKGNEKSIDNLKKRQELLTAALKEAQEKQKTLTDIVDKARAAREKAAEAVRKAREKEGDNSKAVADAEKKYLAANNAVNRYETQLNKANEQVAKYTNEMNGATQETSDFQKVVGNTAAMEAMTKIADKVSGAMSNINKAMADAATEIEEGLSQINKRTGASGEELERYQNIAKRAFGSMPISIESASDAVGELATRFKNLTDTELANLTTSFLQFADVNDTDVASAIDSTQKAMAAFGVDTKDAGTLLDVFNRTGQNTGANAADLASKLVDNAEAFQQMGLDIYEATGFLGELETAGADSNTVLAGMKKALKEATEKGKPFNQALEDMQDAIVNGTDGMDGLTVAYDLFGKSGAGIYTAVKNGNVDFKNLAKSTDILEDATGNLNSTYEATLTTSDKWQIAQNRLADASGELRGEFNNALAPALDGLSGIVSGMTEKFRELPEEVQTVIGVAATLGGKALEVAPQIMSMVTQIVALKAAKTVAGDTSSLAGSLGGLGGKAGIAAAIIASVAAGIAYMTSEIDKATEASKQLKDEMAGLKGYFGETSTEVEELDATLAAASSTEEKIAIVQGLLTKAQTANTKAVKGNKQATQELNKVQSTDVGILAKLIGGFGGTNAQILAQVKQLSNSTEAWTDSNEVMDDSSEMVDYLTAVLEDLEAQQAEEAKQAGDTTAAIDGLGNETEDAAGQIAEANTWMVSSAQTTMEKVQGAIGNMQDAIKKGVDSVGNWFDEVAEKQELSADKLAENLANQIESMKNWQENLSYLADKGINQDLLQYLADMGPSGAAYVQAFVDAANGETEVGLDEMNRLWAEKLDLEGGFNSEAQELLQAVGTATFEVESKLNQTADNAYDSGKDIPISEAEAIAAYTNRPVAAVMAMNQDVNSAVNSSDPYGNGYNIGMNIVKGLTKGIYDHADSAVNAIAATSGRVVSTARNTIAVYSPSRVFAEIGKYIDLGLAKGINDYSYVAEDAVASMSGALPSAIASPDLSKYHDSSLINNQVTIMLGDKELTGVMLNGVVKGISTNQRAQFAMAGGL